MKRILSIFVVLFLLVLPVQSFAICGPAPDPGGDWVFPGGFCDNILLVCPTSEYTTIGEAMAVADAWDTIIVAEGTYNEAVTFTGDNITLRSFGSAENTIITQGKGTTISFSTYSGCTLDGFKTTLSAAETTNDEVIWSNNDSASDYNTVKNCIIEVENKAGSVFGLYGINIGDGNFRLLNNTITVTQTGDSAVYAIWNSAAHPFECVDNTIVLDQDATGAFMTSALAHVAGAGSILYAIENRITTDSEHTGVSVGYSVYAHAAINYVNENIINAVGAAGVMYGLFTGSGDTAYYMNNFINVTTTDGDGEWANFSAATGTSYAHGNTIVGDSILGTGGIIYLGVNQVNSNGITTPYGVIIANNVYYNLFGVTQQDSVTDGESNTSTTISSDGAADDDFLTTCQIGDVVLIYGGTTTADYGLYYITAVTDDDNLIIDTALSATDTDIDFYILRNGRIFTGTTTWLLTGVADTPPVITVSGTLRRLYPAILTDSTGPIYDLTIVEVTNTLITTQGWDGASDITFGFPDISSYDGSEGVLKVKFEDGIGAAAHDLYLLPDGSTQVILDGIPTGTDGHRIWCENSPIYSSIICHSDFTVALDGCWICDSINGIWADKGS